jgi:hypothetical protein
LSAVVKSQSISDVDEPHIKNSVVCPKCGGEVEITIAFTSQFCGIRAVASCKSGCPLSNEEQQRLNLEASDELFK